MQLNTSKWVIVILFWVGLFGLIQTLSFSFVRWGRQVLQAWYLTVIIGLAALVLTMVRKLRQDQMYALEVLGEIVAVYANKPGQRGFWQTGIVIAPLPPPLAELIKLPTEVITLHYRETSGFTTEKFCDKEGWEETRPMPVAVDLAFQFALPSDFEIIRNLFRMFPLRDERDLTRKIPIKYWETDPDTLEPREKEYRASCIVNLMKDATEGAISEAVLQVLPQYDFDKAKWAEVEIQTKIKNALSGIGESTTIFATSGLLSDVMELKDVVVKRIVPADREVFNAYSARRAAQLYAEAAATEGTGRGRAFEEEMKGKARGYQEVMNTTGVSGLAAVTSETLRGNDVTIVTADNLLEGALGRLLGGRQNPNPNP